MKKKRILLFLNVLIVLLVGVTVIRMVTAGGRSILTSAGWKAFRYYTVLSNVLCAVSCLTAALTPVGKGVSQRSYVFQSMGSTVAMVTFLVVLGFLGPAYGYGAMYSGINLPLHLIVPLLALLKMFLLKPDRPLPFSATLWGILPTFLYGAVYAAVNAALWTGRSDPSVDFYGFLKWGWGIGVLFLIAICAVSWLCSVLFRLTGRIGSGRDRQVHT